MWFLWLLTAGWAALMTFGLMNDSGPSPGFLVGGVLLLVGWGPLAALVLFVRVRDAGRDARYRAMCEATGYTGRNGYEFRDGGSGIVLNREQQRIGFVEGAQWKVYPFDAVREWRSSKETAGMIVGGGLAALGANLGAAQRAQAHSGFFVTVRDVDHPVWRIGMQSEQEQARWMEILRQEVNRE